LELLRSDEGWEGTRTEIEKFVTKHAVDVSQTRNRIRKKFFDEVGVDDVERPDPLNKAKQSSFLEIIDCLLTQMHDRFDNQSTLILQEIDLFSHSSIMMKEHCSKGNIHRLPIKADQIEHLCNN